MTPIYRHIANLLAPIKALVIGPVDRSSAVVAARHQQSLKRQAPGPESLSKALDITVE